MDGEYGALPRHYGNKARNWGFYGSISAALFSLSLTIWLEVPAPHWVKVLCTALLAVLLGWVLYSRPRQMTTVDHEGIVVHGLRRRRRLTWDGIHDIRAEALPPSLSWGPDTVTYAYRTDGRRVMLLCVNDEELPALGSELAFMRALLVRRRSAGWTPDPRAEPRIARRIARRAAWDRWMNGWRAFVVLFAFVALLLAGFIGQGVLRKGF
ncbi:PH domain-containing protein [Streptomyces virginiae]